MCLVAALEPVHIARNSAPSYNPDWCAIPSPQANFLSRVIARCSKPIQENFPLGPVEIEVPGTVRQHFLPGIEPQNPRACLIAVYDATLGSCQDSAGNVFVKQYAITLSPQLRFFLNDKSLPLQLSRKHKHHLINAESTRLLSNLPSTVSVANVASNAVRIYCA